MVAFTFFFCNLCTKILTEISNPAIKKQHSKFWQRPFSVNEAMNWKRKSLVSRPFSLHLLYSLESLAFVLTSPFSPPPQWKQRNPMSLSWGLVSSLPPSCDTTEACQNELSTNQDLGFGTPYCPSWFQPYFLFLFKMNQFFWGVPPSLIKCPPQPKLCIFDYWNSI